MNTELVKSQIREQKWKELIEEYSHSGMNVEQYCRYKVISKSAFYKWQRKFREIKLINAGIDEKTFAPPAVIELKPQEPLTAKQPKIVISSKGITVEIDNGIAADVLSSVVKALR